MLLVCFSFCQWDLNEILMRPARSWWESSKILVRISIISSMSCAHQAWAEIVSVMFVVLFGILRQRRWKACVKSSHEICTFLLHAHRFIFISLKWNEAGLLLYYLVHSLFLYLPFLPLLSSTATLSFFFFPSRSLRLRLPLFRFCVLHTTVSVVAVKI